MLLQKGVNCANSVNYLVKHDLSQCFVYLVFLSGSQMGFELIQDNWNCA